MIDHTRRLLARCIERLQEFAGGKIELRPLVAFLEGSISAMEEELPPSFYEEWYEHWGVLEQSLAATAVGLMSASAARAVSLASANRLQQGLKGRLEGSEAAGHVPEDGKGE